MAEFISKRIFLADDDDKFRKEVGEMLEKAGHTIVVEVDSGEAALEIINSRTDLEIDAGVLDAHIPYKGDGAKVAQALSIRFPEILIASISSQWTGSWKDQYYDKNDLHPLNINQLDRHGRSPMAYPQLSYMRLDWNSNAFARAIGEWRFTLDDPRGMETIASAELQLREWKNKGL